MKLSVLMLTYNHENFIAQAIDSVLMQQVNFDYEIVIGEDCSIDKTRDILKGYSYRYPDKFRLLLPQENLGMMKNLMQTLEACNGEYVAIVEGDDYWTSVDKLQKQVDFLDSNPHLSTCFHNVNVVYEDGDIRSHPFHMQFPSYEHSTIKPLPISTLEDIVPGNFIQTCSVMFRNKLFGPFPHWFITMPLGDWPLHILNAQRGNIGYIDQILSVYRVHKGGVWSSNMSKFRKIEDFKKVIYCYDTINKHFNFRYKQSIRKKLARLYLGAINLCAETGQKQQIIKFTAKYLSSLSLPEILNQRNLLILLFKAYFPLPFKFLRLIKSVFQNNFSSLGM